jgi:ornithine carbamoyltransferase
MEFLYRSPSDGVFFVNIRFMFNGDRLAFVKSYHLKGSARQQELPLVEVTASRSNFVQTIRRDIPGAEITITTDAREAVRDAAVVYAGDRVLPKLVTDKSGDATDYRVTASLLEQAPAKALRMHSLRLDHHPALSGEVFDHRKSLVSAQIANRLHVQKGLLVWLLVLRQA